MSNDQTENQAAKSVDSIDWLAAIQTAHDAICVLDASTDGYYRAQESSEYKKWEELEEKLTAMGIIS